jgi:hypothetical protein
MDSNFSTIMYSFSPILYFFQAKFCFFFLHRDINEGYQLACNTQSLDIDITGFTATQRDGTQEVDITGLQSQQNDDEI